MNDIEKKIMQAVEAAKSSLAQSLIDFLLKENSNYFNELCERVCRTNSLFDNAFMNIDIADLHELASKDFSLLQDNMAVKRLKITDGDAIPAEFCLRAVLLEDLVVDEGVQIIRSDAFCDCISLKNVILPSTLKEIHDFAFGNCVSLQTITLPKHMNLILHKAFNNCISLEKVFFV